MRTLKKSLALVLALVMVLGLGVVGASADNALDNYTDTGDIGDAYLEAVGVLTGLGIVDGMTDTTIEPDGTYTRAQAAKIVATMLLGVDAADSLKATTAPFEDVPTYHWASGYIAYCVEAGIIDGMTATTFEPEGTLTGFQWAKMLLSAVGFGVNGEFEGDSWSLNTATVGHQSGLFSGDLDGADHVALRREQAMLYAFNALTKLPQVTYSKENTNYLYGILGYFFADGTGTTLGWDTFKLKSVEGMVVDNEGMGASATYVDSTVAAEGNVKIDADTGLDLMYHAVRAWYVNDKNHTNVYVYDMATVESTTCPTDKEISDARADSDVDATIGEKGENYQLDVIDNSALDIDDASVVFVADWGTLEYVDAANDTTYVESNTGETDTDVDNDDVMTDVSDIDYGSQVIYLITDSVLESATASDAKEALYVSPVTSTVGVIDSIAQSGGRFTLTLEDGTEIEESVFWNEGAADDTEFFVIGNVYTFVLDTHGDVIYATRDGARDLYVWTGEWRNTGSYNDINTDRGREDRFVNVTTGEQLWAPVYFTNVDNGTVDWDYTPARGGGEYFDISATANDNGLYRAEKIDNGDDTYAAGYYVDTVTAVLNDDQDWFDTTNSGDIYFDSETVTFLVGVGTGSDFEVVSYTGVNALKEAYDVPNNGFITLTNAALTISGTTTDWNASVVFVLAENIVTRSGYVFIPEDIDVGAWAQISGSINGYDVEYTGAYMNGEAYTVHVNAWQMFGEFWRDATLDRGFYSVTVEYDRNGEPTYWLRELVDNVDGTCYYLNVTFADTGVNGAWAFRVGGQRFSIPSSVTIVDTTDHGCDSIADVYYWYNRHDVSVAFTVDAVTGLVDVIYVVDAGWDAQVTIGLTQALQDAGWVITKVEFDNETIDTWDASDEMTSVSYYDDEAHALASNTDTVKVTLYNEKLAAWSSDDDYTLNVNGNKVYHKLHNGSIYVNDISVDYMILGDKDNTFVIGGLELGDVNVTLSNKNHKVSNTSDSFEDIVLGKSFRVVMAQSNNAPFAPTESITDPIWTGTYATGSETDIELTGELSHNNDYVTVTVTPLSNSLTITSGAWAERPIA